MILASRKKKYYHKIRKCLGKDYFRSYCSMSKNVETPPISSRSSFSSNNTIKNIRQLITPKNEKVKKIFSEIKNYNANNEKTNNCDNKNNTYFNLNTTANTNIFMKPRKKNVFKSISIRRKILAKNVNNNINSIEISNTPQLEKKPRLSKKISRLQMRHKRSKSKTQLKNVIINPLNFNYKKISKNKKFINVTNKNYKTIIQCKYLSQKNNKIIDKNYRGKMRQKLRDKISNEIKFNSKIRSEEYIKLFNIIYKTFNEIKKLIDTVDDTNIIISDISNKINSEFGDSLSLDIPSLFEDSVNLNYSIHNRLYNNRTNSFINKSLLFEEEKQNINLKTFKVNNNVFSKNNESIEKCVKEINIDSNNLNNDVNNKCIEKINNKDNNKTCNIF